MLCLQHPSIPFPVLTFPSRVDALDASSRCRSHNLPCHRLPITRSVEQTERIVAPSYPLSASDADGLFPMFPSGRESPFSEYAASRFDAAANAATKSDHADTASASVASSRKKASTIIKSTKKAVKKGSRVKPGAPARPLSAYNIFFKDQREQLLRERKEGIVTDDMKEAIALSQVQYQEKLEKGIPTKRKPGMFEAMAKVIGGRWKSMSDDERRWYQQLAEKDTVRYHEETEQYHQKLISQSLRAASQQVQALRQMQTEPHPSQHVAQTQPNESQRFEPTSFLSSSTYHESIPSTMTNLPVAPAVHGQSFQTSQPYGQPFQHVEQGFAAVATQPSTINSIDPTVSMQPGSLGGRQSTPPVAQLAFTGVGGSNFSGEPAFHGAPMHSLPFAIGSQMGYPAPMSGSMGLTNAMNVQVGLPSEPSQGLAPSMTNQWSSTSYGVPFAMPPSQLPYIEGTWAAPHPSLPGSNDYRVQGSIPTQFRYDRDSGEHTFEAAKPPSAHFEGQQETQSDPRYDDFSYPPSHRRF